jgi:hypothetical protein
MKCENNCQNKFICHPEQQMWCQNKSEQGSDTCYYIDRTNITINRATYYYSQNKFVCNLEQKKC